MQPDNVPSRFFLRLPAVTARTGLGKNAIYTAVRAGSFPAPIRLAYRTSVWDSSEIDAWMDRVAARREVVR